MNKKLTKVVNIYPSTPITGVNPPIRSAVRHVTKSVKDIRACIMGRAKVEEILPNGSVIKLGLDNYDKENYVVSEDVVANNTVTSNDTTNETTADVTVDETTTDDDSAEETIEVNVDAVWKAAYDKFLAGKDLSAMTKKQRNAIKAEARAAADAAVAAATTATVVEDEVAENVTAEETTSDVTVDETVADNTDADSAEEVTTDDAEDLSDVVE